MTFEDWFGSNRYLLKSEGKDRQIFTAEDLEDAWNAAIQASRDSLDRVEFPGNAEALWFRLDEELRKLLTA